MFEKLSDIFPTLIKANKETSLDTKAYKWYTTPDKELIGIPKNNISPKESLLLDTFLTPYHANQTPHTEREKLWIDVLFHDGDVHQLDSSTDHTYRLVYFSLSDEGIDPTAFREAIHGLYPENIPIIWNNSHEGIIIEENISMDEDFISYDEIIDVLVSDFYMNVHLFVGPYYTNNLFMLEKYEWEKECFEIVKKYSKKPVLNYVDVVPFLFLENIDKSSVHNIIDSILQDTVFEDELLKTIKTFLECNSNATLAAKKLYMHRNSLQYRVDKFIEKTGIDVKQFHGALSVYLTLILKQSL